MKVKKMMVVLVVLLLAMLVPAVVVHASDGDMPSKLTLKEGLMWLVSGGGAGFLAFYLIDKVPALKNLGADHKRYVSIALVLGLVSAGWGLFMLMGYEPAPQDWRSGIEQWFSLAYTGLVTSLLVHGATDLKAKRKALEAAEK